MIETIKEKINNLNIFEKYRKLRGDWEEQNVVVDTQKAALYSRDRKIVALTEEKTCLKEKIDKTAERYKKRLANLYKKNTEIVDIMAFDTKDNWYCYEIKITKADFNSKAKKTFIGNYNYYIMPAKLYEEVKNNIPAQIGCYVIHDEKFNDDNLYLYPTLIKKAKRQQLSVDRETLKYSILKSLYREFRSNSDVKLDYLKRENSRLKNRYKALEKLNLELNNKLYDKGYCQQCENLKSNLQLERTINKRLKEQLLKVGE